MTDTEDVEAVPPSLRQVIMYILGNGGALLLGVLICYGVLIHDGIVSMKQWDFLFYYSGARMVVEGHGAALFDLHAIGQVQQALVYPQQVPNGAMPYLYPPYLALIQAPLALLPYEAAYVVWLALNCVVVAACMFCLERLAGLSRRGAFWLRAAALVSLPVLIAVVLGQSSIVLLGCFTLALVSLQNRRDLLAGVALGCALIKPQYVLAPLLVLAVGRRWKAIASFTATALLLLLVPMAILGPSINHGYLQTLVDAGSWRSQVPGFQPVWNRSFAGLSQLLLSPPVSTYVTLVLDALALLLLARSALRSTAIVVPFGLAIVVSLLISPHVLIHDLTLLLVPVAVGLRYRHEGPARLGVILGAGYAACIAGFALTLVVPLQLPVFAMVALGTWLWLTSRHASQASILPFSPSLARDVVAP